MLEHKIFKLIKVLHSRELTTVEKYLSSPTISANSDCVKLFAQICKFHPEMDNPKLTKERLYGKLYGRQPYNDGKMRKLMTQLTQLIEEYLLHQELKKSEGLRARLLAKALGDRNGFELFLEAVESRLRELNKQLDRGRDYFRESYELNELIFFHPGSDKLNKRNEYLNRASDYFERYFTLVTLQIEANNVVRNRLEKGQSSDSYLQVVMQVSEKPEFVSSSAINFFRHLVILLQDQEAEDLDQFKKSAFETFDQLSRFEQDFAINLLRSYAVPMANNGSVPHRQFILDLYKIELERGFFANIISTGAFMNIASLGLSVDEFDWVDYFVNNFNQHLPQDEREITLNYCKGIWYYQKGLKSNSLEDFYNAIQSMNLVPIRAGAKFDIRVRPSLLRIHYEIFERGKETLDELLSQARNFERHLNGSGLYSEPAQASYHSFLRYFKTLARLVSSPNLKKSTVLRFLNKLDLEEGNITLKSWLQEKAKGLAATD